MLKLLAFATLLLSAADHWTTYLCLRAPLAGWHITEANPIADWLFGSIGLVPGLIVDSVVTLGAVVFVAATRRIPRAVKLCLLGFIVMWTAYAVANNLQAIAAIGVSTLEAV